MNTKNLVAFLVTLLFITNSLSIIAQVNTTVNGSKVGRAYKYIYPDNTFSFDSSEPYDYGAFHPQPGTTSIARSIWSFSIPTSIPQGSEVYNVEFSYSVSPSNGFIATNISSLASYSTNEQTWNAVEYGSVIDHFSGGTQTWNVTDGLKDIIQNAVNSTDKKILLGFKSATESMNVLSTAFSSMSLKIYYNRVVNFTVRNNFNDGSLTVNDSNVSSGDTISTYETITNTLRANEPQSNGGINYIWNDDEGPTNKSSWDKKKPGSTINEGEEQSISPVAVFDDNGAEFVANMRGYYSLTFQSAGGSLTVNDSTGTSSLTIPVVDQNSVTFSTVYSYTACGIDYTFSYWEKEGVSITSPLIATESSTYTAVFTAKPNPADYIWHWRFNCN